VKEYFAEEEIQMTQRDRIEFRQYLRQCTDRQVLGVFQKEKDAGRTEYAMLAAVEIERRGLTLRSSK
jgi:hypothetical protein